MGAGTSPADPAPAGGAAEPVREESGRERSVQEESVRQESVRQESVREESDGGSTEQGGGSTAPDRAEPDSRSTAVEPDSGSTAADPGGEAPAPRRTRRFPLFTRDTARPEGGGRAAPRDAPAPARQWPLLTVLGAAGVGLLVVALDPFAEAFRIGTILIGVALIAGAVLRWVVPSVGMLAVRSRFTDLVTYGLMGTLIVLLALVAQPKPWLDVPILEDAVRFTIR